MPARLAGGKINLTKGKRTMISNDNADMNGAAKRSGELFESGLY
jgi:hypothetical protein